MSTYCRVKISIPENKIPLYVNSLLGIKAKKPDGSVVGNPNSLISLLQQYAKEHNIPFSHLYNNNGIDFPELRDLTKIEKGDSVYGGPDIEVPSALLISADKDVDDKNWSEYERKRDRAFQSINKSKSVTETNLDGQYIVKIIAVIPPSVVSKFYPKVQPSKFGHGAYFTLGIVEDRRKPLTEKELPPGKYNPDKPVYKRSVSFCCHNDHKTPEVFEALDFMGDGSREALKQEWFRSFNEMINNVGAKKKIVTENILKNSKNPGSKIEIKSIGDPIASGQSNKTMDFEQKTETGVEIVTSNCDFLLNLSFGMTFSIKEQFLQEVQKKVEEAKNKAIEEQRQKGFAPSQQKEVQEKPQITPATPIEVKKPEVQKSPSVVKQFGKSRKLPKVSRNY